MPRADMTKGVEHAFVGENAVGKRQLRDDVVEFIGHDRSSHMGCDDITNRWD